MEFFGRFISKVGIKPEPKKERDAGTKECIEVRSISGMTAYCAKFIPHLSDLTKPLRDLTLQEVQFVWGEKERKTFQKIKGPLELRNCKDKGSCENEDLVPWNRLGNGRITCATATDTEKRDVDTCNN